MKCFILFLLFMFSASLSEALSLEEERLGLKEAPTELSSYSDCIDDALEVGSDINNPIDTDEDGIPDTVDLDNDNDGLSDCEEVEIGLNPNLSSDVALQGSGGCGSDAFATSNRPFLNSFIRKGFIEALVLFHPVLLILIIRIYFKKIGGYFEPKG